MMVQLEFSFDDLLRNDETELIICTSEIDVRCDIGIIESRQIENDGNLPGEMSKNQWARDGLWPFFWPVLRAKQNDSNIVSLNCLVT